MNQEEWSVSWGDYDLNFAAPFGLTGDVSARVQLHVVQKSSGGAVGSGWFRIRRDDFNDPSLSQAFDVIVISNIELSDGHVRGGLGTEIVRAMAAKFPNALIVGENPNPTAKAWHASKLEVRFPSRMIRLAATGAGARVTPGRMLDSRELQQTSS